MGSERGERLTLSTNYFYHTRLLSMYVLPVLRYVKGVPLQVCVPNQQNHYHVIKGNDSIELTAKIGNTSKRQILRENIIVS
jgi:hypothetical protein